MPNSTSYRDRNLSSYDIVTNTLRPLGGCSLSLMKRWHCGRVFRHMSTHTLIPRHRDLQTTKYSEKLYVRHKFDPAYQILRICHVQPCAHAASVPPSKSISWSCSPLSRSSDSQMCSYGVWLRSSRKTVLEVRLLPTLKWAEWVGGQLLVLRPSVSYDLPSGNISEIV